MSDGPRQRAEALLASVEKQSRELIRLAEVLSLAVRVEPALLRKARLTLTPKLGVSAEADLWFGLLVESSGAGGFMFRREVAELLRERLARDPERLEAAWRLTRSFHPFIPPAAALEEAVTWAALAGQPENELNRTLGQALTAMLSNASRGVGIARWALRALPRLPERARRSESAALLAIGTVDRVDGTWLRLNGALPEHVPSQAWRVLGDRPRLVRKLVREPRGITFLGPEAAEGERIELPDTRPPLLELTWEENSKERQKLVVVEPGTHEALPGNVERLHLRALDGHRWELTTVLAQEQHGATAPSEKKVRAFLSAAWPSSLQLRSALAQHLPEIALTVPRLGETFSSSLGEALLEANLVIVVANEAYWRSEYCRRELRIALLPYTRLPPSSSAELRRAALEHIVIVRPVHGFEHAFNELPMELLEIQWPSVDDISRIAMLLRQRLGTRPRPLRERLRALGLSESAILKLLSDESKLPPPANLASVRRFPTTLPPSLGDSFVGRDRELWELDAILSTGAPSTVFLVDGVAGVGKTRLLLEYIYRFRPRSFPGGIFWVNADASDEGLEEQLHGILRTLEPDTPELTSFRKRAHDAARELALALEKAAHREPILYVVDGIPGLSSERPARPLSAYCPGLAFVSVLVTAREGSIQYSLPNQVISHLRLKLLDSNAAVELLTRGIQKTHLRVQEWQAIAHRVGNLPLALELLNRLLQALGLSPQSLLSSIEENAVRFLDEQLSILKPMIPPGARSITEALEDTYAELSEHARRFTQLTAWCAPAPVPAALLGVMDPEVPDETPFLKELDFLVREIVEGVPVLRMRHRLLADFIRDRSTDPEAELMRVCHGLVALMDPSSLRSPSRWPLLRACLPHAEDVFNRLREYPLETGKAEFVELGIRISRFLLADGYPARARPFAGEAHEHAVEVLGLLDRKTIDALACFAAAERSADHLPEAMRLYDQRRRNLAEALGTTEHSDMIAANMDLADTLLAQPDLASAKGVLESILGMSNRFLGDAHPQTAIVKTLLGQVHQQEGRLEGARRLHQEAIATLRETLGSDHLDTLTAETELATTLAALGDLGAARRLQEEVLERSQKLLREDHPLTVRMTTNLASILEAQGHRDQAAEIRARLALLRLADLDASSSNVEEGHQQEAASFPPPPSDAELQELVRDRFFSGETPHELADMGNTQIHSVDVTWIEHGEVIEARRIITGGGSIGVELMVGADGLRERFPFKFTVEQRADGSLHLADPTVDNSSFYAGQEDLEDDDKEIPE